MIKVGIIGANGYTGYELLRLLAAHGKVHLAHASSRSCAGKKIAELYPSLLGAFGDRVFDSIDIDSAAKCDVIFTALPHGVSADTGAALIKKGKKVIDLSADFRYDNLPLFEKIYGITHSAKDLNAKAVYGLTEIFGDNIKKAQLIANPGCYTTASILALYPLLSEKIISPDNIIIDAKSGTSGAGRRSEEIYSFCESKQNFKAYAIAIHRHTSEIEEKLSIANGNPVALSFTPHLLPLNRGILATIYADLKVKDAKKITAAYDKFYASSPFVKVYNEGETPELKSVILSNSCHIGYKVDTRLNKLVMVSVLDNLIKGASGQAIQNMNLMYGFDETEGLPLVGSQL